MKAEHLNPFIDAAVYVIGEYGFPKPTRGKLAPAGHSTMAAQGVVVFIGLIGELNGRILYDISTPLALSIASKMIGEPQTALDDLGRSALAELGNQITGWANTKLREMNLRTDFSPPTLMTGQAMQFSDLESMATLAVPLQFPEGTLTLNLSIVEKKS